MQLIIIGDIMVMYINKKDLINSINNCEHLDKNKIKNDEKDSEKNIGDCYE
jgi:hypothetical protein